MTLTLKEIDQLSIVTLQDNYVDLLAQDNSDVIQRAATFEGTEIKKSILAEHGFSSFITTTYSGTNRSMLFDFGFSEEGAAVNADSLHVDLTRVEEMALSHGHMDHVGGIIRMVQKTKHKNLPLLLHPAAFQEKRYIKAGDNLNLTFPPFTKNRIHEAGAKTVEAETPRPMLNNTAGFLGGIPRITAFEKGPANMFYEKDGHEIQDTIEDDSAMVFLLKNKGLLIVSGCAHAGIANTISHAKDVTGVDTVYAVMGGFHLSGVSMDHVIKPTTEALKDANLRYVIPTHCTGRAATQYIENQMPDNFLLNMSGTTLTFSA